MHWNKVGPAPRRIDPVDPDGHRIAEANRPPALGAEQHRALLVELPPIAAEAANRQQALVAVAERHERAGADDADDLAVEGLVPTGVEQVSLEQETARDVVRVALDEHRVALAAGRPRARLLHRAGGRRVLAAAHRAEQRAVTEDVGVAPDRRGEVAVVLKAEPRMAEVLRRVLRLLERPQDQRGQRPTAMADPADVLVDEARDLPHRVGRLLGRKQLRQRRRRDLERRELRDESLHAGRLGALVDAVQRRDLALREQPRDLFVGGDHQVLDHPVRLGLQLRGRLDHVAVQIEAELRLGALEHQRAALRAALLQRRRRGSRCGEWGGDRLVGALEAGEDAVDLVVVQARVGADARAVEGGTLHLRTTQLEFDGDREPFDAGHERARVVGQRAREHRLHRAGHVDAGRAPVRLAVERIARAHVGRDVGDVDPHPPVAVAQRLAGERGVEVLGGDGVDRERRKAAEIASTRRGIPVVDRLARLLGRALGARREPPRQPAVQHQRLDHVARDVRPAQESHHLRVAPAGRRPQERELAGPRLAVAFDGQPPPPFEERLGHDEAPPLGEQADDLGRFPQRDSPASTRSALSSASSRAVFGTSRARMFGAMPAPVFTPTPPRLRPFGVKYWPAVMSSAPPLDSSTTSWKTPLPNVRVPTTFARLRSCSAPVTISDAEAVSRSTSTTSGASGRSGLPSAFSVRVGTERPLVVTIVPPLRKRLAISWASSTKPPPLARRSSTKPCAPRFLSFFKASATSAWAPELNVASRKTPSLRPATVCSAEATTGTVTPARSTA